MTPETLRSSFQVAAQELGFWSAGRLFLGELAAAGPAQVEEARAALGEAFPLFGAMAERWVERGSVRPLDVGPLVAVLPVVRRLVVVGYDADPTDRIVDTFGDAELGLVADVGELCGDLDRSLANYGGRLRRVPLGQLPRWAGRYSAMLTPVYGVDGHGQAFVSPAWLRALGPDLRSQFRSLVGWNLLGRAPEAHPRWVVASPSEHVSAVVGP